MKVVTHIRRLVHLVSSPHEAWLLARMLGWSLVLPLLKRAVPLPRLVGLMHSVVREEPRDPRHEQRVAALAEWVFRSRPRRSRDNCLDRALVAYRYLGRAGAEPTIVVGVARGEPPAPDAIAGHVWVTVDGKPVHDDRERLAGFATLAAFSADGRLISTEATTPIVEQLEGRPRTATPPPAAPPR
jgi:hypothetical protein